MFLHSIKAAYRFNIDFFKRKTLLKSLIYRIYSFFLTGGIAYFLTGNLIAALSIGFVDSVFKVFSYYVFDEIWNRYQSTGISPSVIWLTGLSGSGKTTIALDLIRKLKSEGLTPVFLDGDEIRKAIKQNGFDEASRKSHNLNVGYIASLFEKQGCVVIVALISPYEDVRNEVRQMCKNFIEVYVSTPLNICIQRDPKGLYKKVFKGEISEFTGISSPYNVPTDPELILDTSNSSVHDNSIQILKYISK